MVTEASAKAIAEKYIAELRGMRLPPISSVFISAAKRRERILALVRSDEEAAMAAQLVDGLRDCWAIGFDTVLNDGSRLVEGTYIYVDAETGVAKLAE